MKLYKYIITILVVLNFINQNKAQQVNTLYFIDNSPYSHSFNPSFQPMSGFYLGLPIIGNTQVNVGNNSLTVSSLALSKINLLNSIKTTTLINADLQTNLFGFGFRTKNSYWTFSTTAKSSLKIGLPKDFFNLALNGNVNEIDGEPQLENNTFNLKSLSLEFDSYIEAALGYSRSFDEKWAVGLKLKYLHGLATSNMRFNKFDLVSGIDESKLNIDADMMYSVPDFDNLSVSSLLKPLGVGGAIDLGVSYKPIENLTVGASVLDLGLIKWNKSTVNYNLKSDYTFSGVSGLPIFNIIDGSNSIIAVDSLLEDLSKSVAISGNTNPFTTTLSPKINVSAEYGFLNNMLSVGLLSSSQIYNKNLYHDITASLNILPVNWFNMSLSYSLLNGKTSNLGAGLGFRLGFINAFVSADFIPLSYTPLPAPVSVDLTQIPLLGNTLGVRTISKVPYKTDRLNFAIGVNFVFGNKLDADNDGISNRRDKCPDTPHGVIVDKKGCPLDTDGDKVPDYYDKCPDTPKEAYTSIDGDGCPIDTDGDGVFDYLDKCPDTPYQAYPTVDKKGCPKDTDMDGVPDYLDKCPNTPENERQLVNKLGCSTPVVLPKQEPVTIPTPTPVPTPEVVTQPTPSIKVDIDTDGDGIIDRLDRCPQLAGVASNGGCPEIKKEVRVVFQKAIKGIQFETAKYVIKPLSFVILDHVVKVLADNPSYLVEIQGHTDNEGLAEKNQTLSENRAKAVRDYLISKGIDAKRLTANGYGQTRPIVPNTTSEGKSMNRRVEFVVSFE